MIPDYSSFFDHLRKTRLQKYVSYFEKKVDEKLFQSGHGDLKHWQESITSFPDKEYTSPVYNASAIKFGDKDDVSDDERAKIEETLRGFKLWRKGPFDVCGVYVDAEWRSDIKWDRIKDKISPLKNRMVLDVGCGNGYHLWRMLDSDPRVVMGIDSVLLYVMQFHALNRFANESRVSLLPMSLDEMPGDMKIFDTVFCMGVLYHARSPFEFLRDLFDLTAAGGEVVLETLVVDGDERTVLVPERRYARMGNVWFIPSVEAVKLWLRKTGFRDVRCVDVSVTTDEEQRVTDWIGSADKAESLNDFLDPDDSSLTVEGYPAPKRAVFVASKA